MTWPRIRRLFVLAGVAWFVLIIPPSIRPSWNTAPFGWPERTITVPTVSPDGAAPDLAARVKSACRAPWALRPIMGPSKKVRVITTFGNKPVNVEELKCAPYL